MRILQEQKSALPSTPANRATEPSKNREVIYDQILSRYIVLNPVRARMVHATIKWTWSSYSATVCEQIRPRWLNTYRLLASFGQT